MVSFFLAICRMSVAGMREALQNKVQGPKNFHCTVVLLSKGSEGPTERVIGQMGCLAWPFLCLAWHPHFCSQGYITEALRAYIDQLWLVMPLKCETETSHMDDHFEWCDHVICNPAEDDIEIVRALEETGFVLLDRIERYQPPMRFFTRLMMLERPRVEQAIS